MDFEKWIQSWRDAQKNGRLDYYTEEGAREAWDYQQERIAELEEQLAQTQRLYKERDEFAQSLVEDVKQLQYERGQAGKRAIAAEKIIEKAQDDISFAMQADLEHGVWWLNEEASRKFTDRYPELRKALTAFMDIEIDD